MTRISNWLMLMMVMVLERRCGLCMLSLVLVCGISRPSVVGFGREATTFPARMRGDY